MHLIFAHIPKTAGVSLFRELSGHLPALSIGTRQQQLWLQAQPLSALTEYRLLSGHVSVAEWRDKGVTGPAFTVLREPAERLESTYRYLQASRHPDHQRRKFASFELFLEDALGSGRSAEQQCWYVSGQRRAPPALELIERSDILAVPLQQLPEFLQQLGAALGLELKEQRLNVSSGERVAVDPSQRELIDRHCEHDQRLYQAALQHYPRWAAAYWSRWQGFFADLRTELPPQSA